MIQTIEPQVIYTRYEHGGQKVTIEDGVAGKRYELGGKTYTSARKLLIDIHGKDLHLTFDRYFRLGRHGKNSGKVSQVTVLDMFGSVSVPVVGCKNSGTVVIPK